MEKTIAQTHAEWITHGNISRLRYALDMEKDAGRRTWLEGLLQEQLDLAVPANLLTRHPCPASSTQNTYKLMKQPPLRPYAGQERR